MTVTAIPKWTLGDRIRKAREHAGLEQADLANALYMSRAAISAWENGHTTPAPRKVEVIARVCGVPASWLVTGGDDSTVTEEVPGRQSDQLAFCLAA